MNLSVRDAVASDIDAIADIFLRSRLVALPFLPIIYTPDQDRAHMRDMLKRGRITLAISDGKIVGFLVDLGSWVAHLYLDPAVRRQGIGHALLDVVKQRHTSLELWCFQQNWAARAFYEKNGFVGIRDTDGDNEEKLPDRLYRWQKN